MNIVALKKPLIVVCSVAVVVGIFSAGFYLRPVYDERQFDKNTQAAEEFVQQVVSGNNAAAYALTTKTLQEQQDEATFDKAIGSLKSDNAEIQESKAVKSGDTIVYYQRVLNLPKSAKGSTSGLFYITSVKEDGKWKVASATIQ